MGSMGLNFLNTSLMEVPITVEVSQRGFTPLKLRPLHGKIAGKQQSPAGDQSGATEPINLEEFTCYSCPILTMVGGISYFPLIPISDNITIARRLTHLAKIVG
jgi:hypothetical protein